MESALWTRGSGWKEEGLSGPLLTLRSRSRGGPLYTPVWHFRARFCGLCKYQPLHHPVLQARRSTRAQRGRGTCSGMHSLPPAELEQCVP